jgi:hypothetical protein
MISIDEHIHLVFTNKEDGENFELSCPFTAGGCTVPAGFLTDAASIPKVLRVFINQWGKHARAALIHDYLYTIHYIPRKEADRLFLELMLNTGVNKLKAYCMYWAVRLFGNGPWERGYAKTV